MTNTIAILCIKYPVDSKHPKIFPKTATTVLNIPIFMVISHSFIFSLNIIIAVNTNARIITEVTN